jgi:flagella basal body P-ring formation protein FlgA
MIARRLLLSVLFLGSLAAARAADDAPSTPAPGFTSEQLVAALARDLAAHFRLEGDLQLELVRPWTPPVRRAATWAVVISEYPTAATPTLVVRCRVLADGIVAEDDSLVLRAALWRDAWVSRQPLPAGSGFDPAALETRRIDALRERAALPATAGDRSYIFATQVPADHVLTWRDLARRPWVHKGEVIDVVAAEGDLLVTLKAMALENGGRGDVVTVRNLESHKDISGLVVAENKVEVRF